MLQVGILGQNNTKCRSCLMFQNNCIAIFDYNTAFSCIQSWHTYLMSHCVILTRDTKYDHDTCSTIPPSSKLFVTTTVPPIVGAYNFKRSSELYLPQFSVRELKDMMIIDKPNQSIACCYRSPSARGVRSVCHCTCAW